MLKNLNFRSLYEHNLDSSNPHGKHFAIVQSAVPSRENYSTTSTGHFGRTARNALP